MLVLGERRRHLEDLTLELNQFRPSLRTCQGMVPNDFITIKYRRKWGGIADYIALRIINIKIRVMTTRLGGESGFNRI
jgi:hypothetical protein